MKISNVNQTAVKPTMELNVIIITFENNERLSFWLNNISLENIDKKRVGIR